MSKKSVLLMSHYPPPAGGIASWSKRLLKIGLPDGWEIDHVNINTTEGRDPFQNTKIRLGVEVRRCLSIWNKECKFLANDKSIRVVHTCIPCSPTGMMREIISAILAKLYRKKFILHCRCTVPNVVNKAWKRGVWRVLTHFCDGIMVLNTKSYDFAIKHSRCSTVEVIPNFVLKDELIQNEKRCFSSMKRLAYVGGVTAEKGCGVIVEAARSFPELTFDLIGGISSEIEAMDIPTNVVMHGNVPKEHVTELLKQADVFLFLSHYWGEGFSNALTEAMAAGLPCIVTDWAANADQIENMGGIVINCDDVDALKKAISALAENQLFREEASRWNVCKVNSDYIDTVITAKYTRFYDAVCGEKL